MLSSSRADKKLSKSGPFSVYPSLFPGFAEERGESDMCLITSMSLVERIYCKWARNRFIAPVNRQELSLAIKLRLEF